MTTSTRHSLRVRAMRQWEFNDYEGEIEGELDNVLIRAYVVVRSAAEWDQHPPGSVLDVEVWIERSGAVEVLPTDTTPALVERDVAEYDAVGTVEAVDGEEVRLRSVLPLRVDLDLSARTREAVPTLRADDVVRVRGILKVDIHPELG